MRTQNLDDLIGEETDSDLSDSKGSDYNEEDNEDTCSEEEIELETDEVMEEEEVRYSSFGGNHDVLTTKSNKLGIAFLYLNVLHAAPEDDWGGTNGLINKMLDMLNLRHKGYFSWLKEILQAVRVCFIRNIEYTGQGIKKRRGPLPVLAINSEEARIVATSCEKNLGIRHATQRVNTYRVRLGKGILGQTCIFGLFQRLKPLITTIGKMKTGSNDATSNWAVCRLKWAIQFLILLREYTCLSELGLNPDPAKNPTYFDPAKLPKIDLGQIAWWDEHHVECHIAGLGASKTQIRFPRDADGNLDPGGKITCERKRKLNVKYNKQGRFCLGVAMTKTNGNYTGKRAHLFSYTMQKVIGIPAYDKKMKEENQRVEGLAPCPYWVDRTPDDKNLYWSSTLDKLPGISASKKRVLEDGGFVTLEDLKECDQPIKKRKLLELKGIGTKTINNFAVAITSMVGQAPAAPVQQGTDHRKEKFPYLSKFKTQELADMKMKKSVTCNNFCNIKDLVTHLYNESKRMFEGTDHEDDWYFYHDALTTMTSATTIAWMKEMGYYEKWLLPKLEILKGTIYHSSIPGDSPELMPLDNSLNNDFDQCAIRHVAVTLDCLWNKNYKDMRKFSLFTPAEGMFNNP